MAEDAKHAWSEVGEKFASVGRRVSQRYKESETPERTAEEREREIERAVKEIVDELGRGATAVAETVRDEQAKKDLTDAFNAMGAAIVATFDEVRDAIRSNKGPSEPPTPPEAPTPPTTPEPPKD
jgi:DNA-binding ferritin-like protein